jgi:hypothetical protein
VLDLEHALERGQLKLAVAAAKDVAHEYGRPIGLELALRFLPLVAAQQLDAYDGWACRWLARWLNETPGVTADLRPRADGRGASSAPTGLRSRACSAARRVQLRAIANRSITCSVPGRYDASAPIHDFCILVDMHDASLRRSTATVLNACRPERLQTPPTSFGSVSGQAGV